MTNPQNPMSTTTSTNGGTYSPASGGTVSEAATGAVDRMTEKLPNAVSDQAETVADKVKANVGQVGETADEVKDHLGTAVAAGKQGAGEVVGTATEKAREVTEEAVRQARDLIGEARSQVAQQAGDQHKKAAQSLRALSDQLASMVQSGEQDGLAVEMVSQARDHVRSAADWLDQREPGELLDEVRGFARRKPGTFLIGAALAGVLAGRLTRGVVAAHASDGTNGSSSLPSSPTAGTGVPTGLSAASDVSSYPTQVIGYSSPPDSGVGYQPTAEREPAPRSYSGVSGQVTP